MFLLQLCVKELKEEIAANPIKIELNALEPSKQALVSALVCEYFLCFSFTIYLLLLHFA